MLIVIMQNVYINFAATTRSCFTQQPESEAAAICFSAMMSTLFSEKRGKEPENFKEA